MSRVIVVVALLLGASACETTSAGRKGAFRFTGDGVEAAFENWRKTAPRNDREIIDALEHDETLLIHVFRGTVQMRDARGSQSSPSVEDYMRKQCLLHPSSEGIAAQRNWDVILDADQMVAADKRYRTTTTFEILLHHEIIGHIAPRLRGVTGPAEEVEKIAVRAENEYRKAVGLPPVKWGLP